MTAIPFAAGTLRCLCALAVLTVSLPMARQAAAGGPALTPEHIGAFFDAAAAVQRQEHHLVGSVVSVVHRGEVFFKAGYGWADLQAREPVDPDRTLFRIASISKLFVWTALMQLQEQGRVHLDDDVNRHLSCVRVADGFAAPVRIRDLLAHTAGFEDRAIGMSAPSLAEVKPLCAYLSANQPARVRPPGQQVAYSNWGTSLAGAVIEQVSGKRWDDYVDAHVLAPLGMHGTNTHTPPSAEFVARHAKSYHWQDGRFVVNAYEGINDAPAGVMSSTAADMARFMLAHLGGGVLDGQRILRAQTIARMHSPLFEVHEALPAMLHGFYRSDRNGVTIIGHGGDTNRFHSRLALFPQYDLGVFMSFNAAAGDAARSQLLDAFVDHFFPAPVLRPAPQAAAVPLDAYVGEYVPLRSNQSTIERLGTLLTAQLVEQDGRALLVGGERRWVPVADDHFVASRQERSLVFQRGPGGAVTHMVVGEPLSTWRRVSGLAAPSVQRQLIALMLAFALGAAVLLGTALARHWRSGLLPHLAVVSALLHAGAVLWLYAHLVAVLVGDVEHLVRGIPSNLATLLVLLNTNVALGLAVPVLAVRLIRRRAGSVAVRAGLVLSALAALLNLWTAWTFNIIAWLFE